MRRTSAIASIGLASLLAMAVAHHAAPAVRAAAPDALRITSPEAGAAVSGLVVLRAEPDASIADRVVRVGFRVDGETVCVREAPPFECEWDAGLFPAVHVVRAAADLADGGRAVASLRTRGTRQAPRRSGLTLATDVEIVQVVATVTDSKGRFVPGLKGDDFRVFEDEAPQEVAHLIGEDTPREVVVAVDMSGSMTSAMPQVRTAVRAFLAALRPDDQVTVLAFNDAIFTLARRETDPEARARAVGRLAPWGGTSLYDVILKGMDLLASRRGRKVLVVFTDGEDQSSRASLEDVQRRAETNDAPVYMVGQGRGTSDHVLRGILDRLAAMSGGRAFHTDDPRELQGVFAEIVDEIAHQYLLGYQPTNGAHDASWRRIRVEVPGQGRSVRARQGYRALPRGGSAGGMP